MLTALLVLAVFLGQIVLGHYLSSWVALVLGVLALCLYVLLISNTTTTSVSNPLNVDKPKKIGRLLLQYTLILFIGFSYIEWRTAMRLEQNLAPALEGIEIIAEGVISNKPIVFERYQNFQFELTSAQLSRPNPSQEVLLQTLIGRTLSTSWWQTHQKLEVGQHWRFTLKLSSVWSTQNPHGFDYESYRFFQNKLINASVRKQASLLSDQRFQQWQYPLERIRSLEAYRIEQWFTQSLARDVLLALAIGDQSGLDSDEWAFFRGSGIIHLISISGLHITLFAWLVQQLLTFCWGVLSRSGSTIALKITAPNASYVLGFIAALAYSLVSGFAIPAQRTTIMLAVITWSKLSSRHLLWHDILAYALLSVILFDPWSVLQSGFWLSFVAVAVLMQTPDPKPTLTHSALPRLWYASIQWLKPQLLIYLVISVLSIVLFQQWSWTSLLVNIIAIPVFTLVITPLAVVGIALPDVLARFVWNLAQQIITWLVYAIEALQLDQGLLWQTAPEPIALFWVVIGIVLVSMDTSLWLRLVGVSFFIPMYFPHNAPIAQGELVLTFFDVGQGTAVLVQTNSHTLLFDTGPSYTNQADAGERIIIPALVGMGVKRIDRVVVSHEDQDHAGGFESIYSHFPVAIIQSPKYLDIIKQTTEKLSTLTTLKHTSFTYNQPKYPDSRWLPCVAGQAWQWDGVSFQVLHPNPSDLLLSAGDASSKSSNNALSCVLLIESTKARWLLTADVGANEESLLINKNLGKLDGLVVAHHGSRFSSSLHFLQTTLPTYAVIQNGGRNPYGHPHKQTLQRLAQVQTQVLRTDFCGALRWNSANQHWQAQRLEHQRYTQQSQARQRCQIIFHTLSGGHNDE